MKYRADQATIRAISALREDRVTVWIWAEDVVWRFPALVPRSLRDLGSQGWAVPGVGALAWRCLSGHLPQEDARGTPHLPPRDTYRRGLCIPSGGSTAGDCA
ncbi:hypothetical protein GCM10022402_39800 [Salinactinospora qingdaonensis]|uniref:Uncharacterized protein n=1 Tax=Salinactinospora qingdaonensis TaxID=702744 RepID=A0ABP7G861_9ACTN